MALLRNMGRDLTLPTRPASVAVRLFSKGMNYSYGALYGYQSTYPSCTSWNEDQQRQSITEQVNEYRLASLDRSENGFTNGHQITERLSDTDSSVNYEEDDGGDEDFYEEPEEERVVQVKKQDQRKKQIQEKKRRSKTGKFDRFREKIPNDFLIGLVFKNYQRFMFVREIYDFIDVYMPWVRTIEDDSWKSPLRTSLVTSKFFEKEVLQTAGRKQCKYHFNPLEMDEWHKKYGKDFGLGKRFLANEDDLHDIYHGLKGPPTPDQIQQAILRDAKFRKSLGISQNGDDKILARGEKVILAPIRRIVPAKNQTNLHQPYQRNDNYAKASRLVNQYSTQIAQSFGQKSAQNPYISGCQGIPRNTNRVAQAKGMTGKISQVPERTTVFSNVRQELYQLIDHKYTRRTNDEKVVAKQGLQSTSSSERIVTISDPRVNSARLSLRSEPEYFEYEKPNFEPPQQLCRPVFQQIQETNNLYNSHNAHATTYNQEEDCLRENRMPPLPVEEHEHEAPQQYPVTSVIDPGAISLFDF